MHKEERAIIVDTEDNVLEYRERSKVGTFDLHRIVAVWIVNDKQEVLIAQRALTMKNQPGLWGPAGAGTVAEGEEYAETAKRELAEEIGLTGIKLVEAGKFSTDKAFGECRMCMVFTGVYTGSLTVLNLQKEEVAAVKWVGMTELSQDIERKPQNYVINMKQVADCVKL